MNFGSYGGLPTSPFAGEKPDVASRPVAFKVEIPSREIALLNGAQDRIIRSMCAMGFLGCIGFLIWKGWGWGFGFLLGAVLSILNFHWLRSAGNLLADAFRNQEDQQGVSRAKPRKPWIIVRFIFRYALLGACGYVIFLSSAVSLEAFLAGLFVLVGGLMAEAAYQVFHEFSSPVGKN